VGTSLVGRDIETFRNNQRNGDVGSGDDARERKLLSIIRDYIVRPSIPASYRVPEKLHKDGLVPRSYLQMRVQTVSAFANHKLGVSKALDEALRSWSQTGGLTSASRLP
jgi:hypothetical protein